MKDNLSRYTLRIDQTLLDKLGYIAEYEGRTKNRELEHMIKIQFCFGCTNSRRRIACSGVRYMPEQPKSLISSGFRA